MTSEQIQQAAERAAKRIMAYRFQVATMDETLTTNMLTEVIVSELSPTKPVVCGGGGSSDVTGGAGYVGQPTIRERILSGEQFCGEEFRVDVDSLRFQGRHFEGLDRTSFKTEWCPLPEWFQFSTAHTYRIVPLDPPKSESCPACDGDGLQTGPPECRPCKRCKGTGWIRERQCNENPIIGKYQCPDCNGDLAPQNINTGKPIGDAMALTPSGPVTKKSLARIAWETYVNSSDEGFAAMEHVAAAVETEVLKRHQATLVGLSKLHDERLKRIEMLLKERDEWEKKFHAAMELAKTHMQHAADYAKERDSYMKSYEDACQRRNELLTERDKLREENAELRAGTYANLLHKTIADRDKLETEIATIKESHLNEIADLNTEAICYVAELAALKSVTRELDIWINGDQQEKVLSLTELVAEIKNDSESLQRVNESLAKSVAVPELVMASYTKPAARTVTEQQTDSTESRSIEHGERQATRQFIWFCNKCGHTGLAGPHGEHDDCSYFAAPTQPVEKPQPTCHDCDGNEIKVGQNYIDTKTGRQTGPITLVSHSHPYNVFVGHKGYACGMLRLVTTADPKPIPQPWTLDADGWGLLIKALRMEINDDYLRLIDELEKKLCEQNKGGK